MSTKQRFYTSLRCRRRILSSSSRVRAVSASRLCSPLLRRLACAAEKSPTKKIVVLIDEYDEPVAKFLDDLETLKKVRSDLHDFYEKLKVNSGAIRFLMMTGVTKLSVFSELNHLTDLTMDPRFATLLGYTPDELDVVVPGRLSHAF